MENEVAFLGLFFFTQNLAIGLGQFDQAGVAGQERALGAEHRIGDQFLDAADAVIEKSLALRIPFCDLSPSPGAGSASLARCVPAQQPMSGSSKFVH